MKRLTKPELIELMRRRQGDRTASEFARELGITPQYLSDVYADRREPGPAILNGLGLQREVAYVTQ